VLPSVTTVRTPLRCACENPWWTSQHLHPKSMCTSVQEQRNKQSNHAGIAQAPALFVDAHARVQVQSHRDILNAKKLLFPGVGSYGQAMGVLQERGYVEPLREYLQARPAALPI
jgi:imidazoleglycerol phosphate synthase glutamine amidotransferase subunit HisH